MLIDNKNFRLYYWDTTGKNIGFAPINTSKYAYKLEPNQKLRVIRFDGSNAEMYVHPTVLEVSNDGILITHLLSKQPTFVPWVKSLPNAGIFENRDMFIVPCEYLYEKNKMEDILTGNIETFKILNDKVIECGIWHNNSKRCNSSFEKNLENFVPIGQISLF